MQEYATSVTMDGPVPPVSAASVARAAAVSSAALCTLRAARIPYMCLSRRADFLDSDFVGIDDGAAAAPRAQTGPLDMPLASPNHRTWSRYARCLNQGLGMSPTDGTLQ